ncbi:MAG: hypothetical protein GX159_03530 [Flavobacteriaceae bacterium]|jgi:magnesium-transporting ATPase (P-type)|nr:hypothetical protein [Flavobacteriaceae bacterium]
MSKKEFDINDELDDLKSLWKNQLDEKNYGKDDIFKMIHRKSINSVQWLFIITILEFIFGILMSLWSVFSGQKIYSPETINAIGLETYSKFESISHVGLIGSVLFISVTYYFYRKISSALSVNKLMQTIMRFRKTITWLIICWIAFTLVLVVPLMMEMGENSYMNAVNHESESMEQMRLQAKKTAWIFAGIMIGFITVFCAVYYGIIYGIFLRRLGKNIKELRSIEN